MQLEKENLLEQIDCECSCSKFESAIKKANAGYKKYKDNCFLNKLVQIYIYRKDLDSAIKTLKKMRKTEPNNILIIEKIAHCFFKLQNFEKALKFYKQMLALKPYNSQYNFNVASMYHFLKDYINAEKFYRYAVEISYDNLSALNNLGLVYYETNRYEEARVIFDKAISVDSTHPEAYHHLGVLNREVLDDMELSILYLKKALRIDPNYPLNSYQLALSYKKIGDIEKAKYFFENTLKLNSKFTSAKDELDKLMV